MSENYQIRREGEYCLHCTATNGMPQFTESNTRICNVCGFVEERKIRPEGVMGNYITASCGCGFSGVKVDGHRERLSYCPIHDPDNTNKRVIVTTYIAILNKDDPQWKNRQAFTSSLDNAKKWALGMLINIEDTVSIFKVVSEHIITIEGQQVSVPAVPEKE